MTAAAGSDGAASASALDPTRVWRYDGEILGVGSASGTRLVVGLWRRSPFGTFADVMVEDPGGRRTLLAPSREIADEVARLYRFDQVRLGPVRVQGSAASDAHPGLLVVSAPGLRLTVTLGGRDGLGRVLSLLPRGLAASTSWARVVDAPARLLAPGVRTAGLTRDGRRATYGAWDRRRAIAVEGTWSGEDLGVLAPVDPPVRFGFGSSPRAPGLTRVVTTVRP
ncbi:MULTISPECIES: hypothetical protein [Miniimonas]|uniref:hypothetical protein n=1 Tax=Miniimonas TaxID=947525 RepID=UPI001F3C7BED|nr:MULTISPECIES: hypothetical protein [Miniimonas]